MNRLYFMILYIIALGGSLTSKAQQNIVRKKASGHPMEYYVSLPEGWTMRKKWPILVVAESADKKFRETTELFAKARKSRPYIIVVPYTVTNGNYGTNDPKVYPYNKQTWDLIQKKDVCWFDETGLKQVLSDVRRIYNGSDKFFITGFEAGAHLVWTMVFLHPDQLYAAAPVAGNYIGRCVDEKKISKNPARSNLPIKAFYGQLDEQFGIGGTLYKQWLVAKDLAFKYGYTNIREASIEGKAHVWPPEDILNWFDSIPSAPKQ